MDDNKETELFIEISRSLGEMNSKLGSLCDTIAKHEQRISNLEQGKFSMRDDIIKWLVRGLISSIMIIGSLTGAAGLITKVIQ